MRAEEFHESMPGRLVPLHNGPPDAQSAFVPNPLPPKWTWPERLWRLLLEARKCLSSLDGTGKHLPDTGILLAPLQSREAQLSSQLEGAITDPQQQALFQADPRYPISAADPTNAFREVFNYRAALRLRLGGSKDPPLSLRLVKDLHAVLMHGVRGSDKHPGEFRTIQNQIGRPARFVPLPPAFLPEALSNFEDYLHGVDDDLDPLVKAFIAHYQFETIHPFGNGNGRVGRLLLSLMIAEWCKLSGQWLYMSAFFEKRKREYMDLLFAVSTHGSWDLWIQFCLEGVVEQSLDTEKRCDKLLAAHRDFHKRLKGGSVRLSTLVDGLFEIPVVTVKAVKNKFDISYPTAKSDLNKLHVMGIVEPLEGLDLKTYYCPTIYRVTYEDVP